mgnify:CR=1 FL=1
MKITSSLIYQLGEITKFNFQSGWDVKCPLNLTNFITITWLRVYEFGSHRLVASSLPVFSIYTCSDWNQGKSIKPTAAATMTCIPVYQSVSTTHCMMVHTCLMWVP